METTKTYTVGEYSRRYLDALDAFAVFKDKLFTALTVNYGEKQGEEFAQSHTELFDTVERTVLDYLRYNFTLEMGTGKAEITL